MMSLSPSAGLLAAPLPDDRGARLLLLAFRRMGAFGLNDAPVSHHFLTAFGRYFRGPLVLTRVLIHEISAAAQGPIQIAPGCCPRMTPAERAVIDAALRVEETPDAAALLLGDLLDTRRPDAAVTSLAAMASAYREAGIPIGGWR